MLRAGGPTNVWVLTPDRDVYEEFVGKIGNAIATGDPRRVPAELGATNLQFTYRFRRAPVGVEVATNLAKIVVDPLVGVLVLQFPADFLVDIVVAGPTGAIAGHIWVCNVANETKGFAPSNEVRPPADLIFRSNAFSNLVPSNGVDVVFA